jgi:hypothetical protein
MKTNFSKARLSFAVFCSPFSAGYDQGKLNDSPSSKWDSWNSFAGDITEASLFFADLRGCSITTVVGWESARLQYANIHGASHVPAGFVERAVSIREYDRWLSQVIGGGMWHPAFGDVPCPASQPREYMEDTPP